MKTLFTLSLLPLIVLAYFFSKQFYVAADYVAAYALIAVGISSLVFFIYETSQRLEHEPAYRS